MGDMPMASGSARVSRRRPSFDASKGSRLPTKSCRRSAASTKPTSVTPSEKRTCSSLQRFRSSRSAPRAAKPATMPAIVGSTRVGKTLFVPVESGTRLTSRAARASARLVPSPPSVTIVPTPASRNAATAASVSRASCRSSVSRTCTRADRGSRDNAIEAMRNGSAVT